MSTAELHTDLIAYLRELTSEQIIDRLDALDAEARALRVLLRSVRARERAAARAARPVLPEETRSPRPSV